MPVKKAKARKKTQNRKRGENSPTTQAALKIALIFFVAVSIIFIAARTIGGVTLTSVAGDIKVFFQSVGRGEGYPYKTTGEPPQLIFSKNGKAFVFSRDKTLLLSQSAKKISEIPIEYGNPAIKFDNGKAIVYDRDSGKLRIQSTSEIIAEKDMGGIILAAGLGKRGNFAVATQGKGSAVELKVYNKRQCECFKWEFTGEKVTDIDLSDDGKYAAVSTMVSKNAQVNSKVYVFKFDSKKYIACFDFENCAVVNVSYDSAHNIEIISNTGRSYISDNSTLGETEKFGSDILFKLSKPDRKYSAVALKKYGGDNYGTVKIFKGGKLKSSIDVDREIKDVVCTEKYTFVLTSDSVMIFKNRNGVLKKEIDADISASEITVSGGKVYIMSPSEIIREKV